LLVVLMIVDAIVTLGGRRSRYPTRKPRNGSDSIS
jgi:hypothetical protein